MNAVAKIEQHNPIGTDGFEFVEFTAPDAKGIEQLRQLFNMMGFTETAKHRSKEVFLFQQNDINIVLNGSPTGHVHEFALKHGPSACAMAFRVKNASQAAAYAESQGAKLVGSHANFGELNIPCLEGIGGSLLYLVDRYGDRSIYDVDFEFIEGRSANDNSGRPDLHRPPDPQRQARPDGRLVRFLRAHRQLPRDSLLRHRRQAHRPVLPRHDRTLREDPHPDQRIGRRYLADRGIHPRIPWRRHPAHRPDHRRHLCHRAQAARQRREVHVDPGHLLREGRHPRRRAWRAARATARTEPAGSTAPRATTASCCRSSPTR